MIDDFLLTVALSPLLLPQGIYTRKVTPKLPEPEGAREGMLGEGVPLNVLILGDSAAAGVGVSKQRNALTGQLLTKLADYRLVQWRLEAETGLNTQQVLARLQDLEAFEVDLVVVSLGVNDVTGGTRLKHWSSQQRALCEVLKSKFRAKHILLSSVPPMHEFPALPQPLRWFLGRRSSAMNMLLNQHTSQDEDVTFVEVKFPIHKDYFARDGFHPSAKAYGLWSDVLLEHIKAKGLL